MGSVIYGKDGDISPFHALHPRESPIFCSRIRVFFACKRLNCTPTHNSRCLNPLTKNLRLYIARISKKCMNILANLIRYGSLLDRARPFHHRARPIRNCQRFLKGGSTINMLQWQHKLLWGKPSMFGNKRLLIRTKLRFGLFLK